MANTKADFLENVGVLSEVAVDAGHECISALEAVKDNKHLSADQRAKLDAIYNDFHAAATKFTDSLEDVLHEEIEQYNNRE